MSLALHYQPRIFTRLWLVLLACAGMTLVGCGGSHQSSSEEQNPYIRRAKEKAQESDLAGAIQMYKRALEDDHTLAKAHLELGILFDETKDYISAIYHYGKFLELRPTVEPVQRKWVEDCIRHAKYSFVAEMPVNPGARKTIEDLNLQLEDTRAKYQKLQALVLQLQKQLGLPQGIPDSAPARTGQAAPVAQGPREHKVVSGDSLRMIAQKYYGNPEDFKKIMQANDLDRVDRLKVGQKLKIP